MRSTSTTSGGRRPPFERATPTATPATTPDPSWIGLIVTPNHPEYPAAHGCFSGASIETLKYFFGTDKVSFSMDSAVAGVASPRLNLSPAFRRAHRGSRRPDLRRDALSKLHANRGERRKAGLKVHDPALLPPVQRIEAPELRNSRPCPTVVVESQASRGPDGGAPAGCTDRGRSLDCRGEVRHVRLHS